MAVFLSSEKLIQQARELEPDNPLIKYPKDALMVIWGHGMSDEQEGSVSEPPFHHVFRVANWLLWTDDEGFEQVGVHNDDEKAQEAIEIFREELEHHQEALEDSAPTDGSLD